MKFMSLLEVISHYQKAGEVTVKAVDATHAVLTVANKTINVSNTYHDEWVAEEA